MVLDRRQMVTGGLGLGVGAAALAAGGGQRAKAQARNTTGAHSVAEFGVRANTKRDQSAPVV